MPTNTDPESVAAGLTKARTAFCATCGGEFDEAEWNASLACPECEEPKRRTTLQAKETK